MVETRTSRVIVEFVIEDLGDEKSSLGLRMMTQARYGMCARATDAA